MAVQKIPAAWSQNSNYDIGDLVSLNGIGYRCTVAHSATTMDPIDNSGSWEVYGVFGIEDYYSLQEYINFVANPNNDIVTRSIPVYINNTEQKLSKLLRSPGQKVTRVFTMTTNSRIAIRDDMLEIEHIRWNQDTKGYTLRDRGSITIQKADKTTFEELRQSFDQFGFYPDDFGFEYPVYYNDDQYIYISPDFENGTEFEITYFERVAPLGQLVGAVNDNGEPTNTAGQTLAQWTAAGNQPDTFVQQTFVNTYNLWVATTPHLLKAGALMQIAEALQDPDRYEMFEKEFNSLFAATHEEFQRWKTQGSISLQQSSGYESTY